MKAIASTHTSSFFSAASAGPLTSVWSAPFLNKARCSESIQTRAARRRLRLLDDESHGWQELTARVALGLTMVSAYATAIYAVGNF